MPLKTGIVRKCLADFNQRANLQRAREERTEQPLRRKSVTVLANAIKEISSANSNSTHKSNGAAALVPSCFSQKVYAHFSQASRFREILYNRRCLFTVRVPGRPRCDMRSSFSSSPLRIGMYYCTTTMLDRPFIPLLDSFFPPWTCHHPSVLNLIGGCARKPWHSSRRFLTHPFALSKMVKKIQDQSQRLTRG